MSGPAGHSQLGVAGLRISAARPRPGLEAVFVKNFEGSGY